MHQSAHDENVSDMALRSAELQVWRYVTLDFITLPLVHSPGIVVCDWPRARSASRGLCCKRL